MIKGCAYSPCIKFKILMLKTLKTLLRPLRNQSLPLLECIVDLLIRQLDGDLRWQPLYIIMPAGSVLPGLGFNHCLDIVPLAMALWGTP